MERKRVLYNFQGITDGSAPAAGVVADAKGNLYGTTYKYDGENDGVADQLRKASGAWKDRVLYTFTNNGGGEDPYAGLLASGKGKFYGTTIEGGMTGSRVEFELVLGVKGHSTIRVCRRSAAWRLQRTYGGPSPTRRGTCLNDGLRWSLTAPVRFTSSIARAPGAGKSGYSIRSAAGSDCEYPSGALVLDPSGNLYGAASDGGASGNGGVFEITR